jgi:hypothetical protein
MTKKIESQLLINIAAPNTGGTDLYIKGKTPFICNAASAKAKHELLLPHKKTATERASQLKHIPLEEYQNSVYRHVGNQQATRIFFPAGGFKKAMMSAALELPGTSKASIARLLWIEDLNVDLYGVPQLFMSMTRSADMNRTPDIRTRAILPEWAARLRISFIQPKLNSQMVANLLWAAGLMIGCGDWRQEKGSGNYGQFAICTPEDFATIAKGGRREAQDQALANPELYDAETERLYHWYEQEIERRHDAGDAAAQNSRRRNGNNQPEVR